jgi:2-oxoglutarate/2-oxoacid ferredoxin oxidoreductase subunit alpha
VDRSPLAVFILSSVIFIYHLEFFILPLSRFSIKIVGASGQGVVSTGEILAKGLKRSGYCVFGYREYPSLIKGGHSSYQLDVSPAEIRSPGTTVDILVTLNHHGLELNLADLKPGGVVIHDTKVWDFPPEHAKLIDENRLKIVYLPVEEILGNLKAKPILANVLLSSFVWSAIKGDMDALKELVGERFKHKKDVLELNMRCVEEGFRQHAERGADVVFDMPAPEPAWKDHLLLIGAQAMGLGIVHAGCRLYAGYPMTPSSPILSFIAEIQNETGMVIKQAEDEITAAQMVSGAMHAGCRAITATSGGGFDLMTETLSMNGIIENPTVFILAQRPGPATGLPTWTSQGDLLLAVYSGHGEYSRCVLSVSDSQDGFDLLPVAFNIAERYQISVIVLTDKHMAEGIYTQKPYDQSKATLERGKILTDPKKLAAIRGGARYDPHAEDGVSWRWLPGTEAADTWNAQADEHNGDGSIDESGENAAAQMEKRMRKQEALSRELPEPELYLMQNEKLQMKNDNPELDVLFIGWGSTKGTVLDALESDELKGRNVGYLHWTYLWPLKTERFMELAKKVKKVVLIEGNYMGQLGVLLAQTCGFMIQDKILRYDGRPFFVDELSEQMASFCPGGVREHDQKKASSKKISPKYL